MDKEITNIMNLIHLSQKLKMELRHSWLTNGRQESVAEHTWRVALMAILVKPYLDQPINLEKLIKMIIIHDLVEAESGDIPSFDTIYNEEQKELKHNNELLAIRKITESLPYILGDEIYSLWIEFENKNTYESKVANALDKLEAQIQHNEADLTTWLEVEYGMTYQLDKHVEFDSFLIQLKDAIVTEGESKMVSEGVDVKKYKCTQ